MNWLILFVHTHNTNDSGSSSSKCLKKYIEQKLYEKCISINITYFNEVCQKSKLFTKIHSTINEDIRTEIILL